MANTTNFGWETPDDTDLVKDGAAAIRTLGSAIDTSLVDLKGGTTGQVLSKASNTDMDFTWVAQDDSNAIQNAIVDAKGDLISASAADTPARLASSGVNGDVLTVDTSTSTGLKWSAPASGSLTLLSTTTLSGTSTTISSINQTYKNLLIIATGIYTSLNSQEMYIAFNTSPANHQWRFVRTSDSTVGAEAATNQTSIRCGLTTTSTGSDRTSTLVMEIFDYATSNAQKPVRYSMDVILSGGQNNSYQGVGIFSNTSAITQIVASMGAGNFSAGTFRIFGVN